MTYIPSKQRAVLGLVARGWTNQAIADELGVSYSTVWKRLGVLMKRAGVSNRLTLVVRALQLGWIHLADIQIDVVG